jgi:hypothetical protein
MARLVKTQKHKFMKDFPIPTDRRTFLKTVAAASAGIAAIGIGSPLLLHRLAGTLAPPHFPKSPEQGEAQPGA